MSKIQINFDDLQDFAIQLGKAANKCDEALGHINVDLYSLLANIPGVASKNIHELETIFESNLKKYKKNLVKAQHLMRLTEAIMSETERKLVRKAREIVQENTWDFTPLRMGDKNILAPQQVEGLRNYIRRLKDGEMVSNLDAYRAMPEDNTWQGNIFPSNPGRKPEVDDVTKALGKFAFDFLVGDVVTILDPEALTEDKLIAAAMMLPPAKVVKLVDKLKDLEKMKDTIDNLDDVSDRVKDTSDNLQDASKGAVNSLSSGKVEHVLKDHTYGRMENTINKMMEKGLTEPSNNLLEKKSFFNPNWSEQKVIDATNQAYDKALSKGITHGEYTVKVFDVNVIVYMENGVFRSAYGNFKLTLSDFGF